MGSGADNTHSIERNGSTEAAKKVSATSFTLLADPEEPEVDLVFIHGFTGHPERTWTFPRKETGRARTQKSSGHGISYPRLSRRREFSRTDMTPTYVRHNVFGPPVSKSTVYDIAWNFLVELETQRKQCPLRPLVFVAHSLGGIVTKECLRRSHGCRGSQSHLRTVYNSTYGIAFFGTPHGGADPRSTLHHIAQQIITIAGVSVNEQIVNALLPSSERLKELRNEFGQLAREKMWTIYSFQEEYGVGALNGKKVVEDVSSCLGDPSIEITQRINNNHMDMCRFKNLEDIEYKKAVAALQRIIDESRKAIKDLPTPGCVEYELPTRSLTWDSLLESLKFDNIGSRYATIKAAHSRTCKWLLNNPNYLSWCDRAKIPEHHGFLWIKGKPGAGKSTIMKFVYANAVKEIPDAILVSFFFNARGETLEHTVEGMYRSLLFQIFDKVPEIAAVVSELRRIPSVTEVPTVLSLQTLETLLRITVEHLGNRQLFCFIDALDECEEASIREMVTFFESLGHLNLSSHAQLKVCFSSRHYPNVSISNGINLVLEDQEGHGSDISKYLDSVLKIGKVKKAEEIKEEIKEKASGVFLWVVLVVQMLNREYDKGRLFAVKRKLGEIPSGLNELFSDILVRDKENVEELVVCIQWVLFAYRPLKPRELYFAILTSIGAEPLSDPDLEEVSEEEMEKYIIDSSKGLAEMTKTKRKTIQFIHESVRDYFLKENGIENIKQELSVNFKGSSHDSLAQSCRNFIIGYDKRNPDFTKVGRMLHSICLEEYPFLEYATDNILRHAEAAEENGMSQKLFILTFPCKLWTQVHNIFAKFEIRCHKPDVGLLYILAERNCPRLIQSRRDAHIGYLVEIKGGRYEYPILAAAIKGNEEAVRAIFTAEDSRTVIGSDFDYVKGISRLITVAKSLETFKFSTLVCRLVDEDDAAALKILLHTTDLSEREFTTTLKGWDRVKLNILLLAISKKRETIALYLIEKEIGLYPRSINQSPLHCAAKNGLEAVVSALLDKVENFDSTDGEGMTSLMLAAANGHHEIVKLFLKMGATFDLSDHNNRTPLSHIAGNGNIEVLKMLLRKGAKFNSSDDLNRTPLSYAAINGHKAVVETLLDEGAEINCGRAPLTYAAESGHEALVQMLLEKGANIEVEDGLGRTSLMVAARNGHEAVAQILLSKGADINSFDRGMRTPLSLAVESGRLKVMDMLLDVGADLESADWRGRTPLWYAASTGNTTAVKILLEKGANRSWKDKEEMTPMHGAAEKNRSFEVFEFLTKMDFDINDRDVNGRTPAHVAVENGARRAILALCEGQGFNPYVKNNEGLTPYELATKKESIPLYALDIYYILQKGKT